MDWGKLPIEEILREISNEPDADAAFKRIVILGQKSLPSTIWESFNGLKLRSDIQKAAEWIQKTILRFPNTRGIYLGLDTLNMDGGKGSNIEIGLCENCDPKDLNDDWIFKCKNYGRKHLIESLYLVSDCFENKHKWSSDERRFAEYVIFLGYSGIVLRDALLVLKGVNDFISVWGFHDGDMFYLVNRIAGVSTIITNSSL